MRNLIMQHWVIFLLLILTLVFIILDRIMRGGDIEVKKLKKVRQIDFPDDVICLDVRELSFCVSCEKVFNTGNDCPHCASKVNMPLVRITQSVLKKWCPEI